MSVKKIPKNIRSVELYAWIGEDELGSGNVGIKMGLVPAGCIPIVAIKKKKIVTTHLLEQFKESTKRYGTPKYLCKFKFEQVEMIIENKKSKSDGNKTTCN